MGDESLNQTGGTSNMNQSDSILQKSSGKLELVIEAMRTGDLNENALYGLRAILGEVKDSLDSVGAGLKG